MNYGFIIDNRKCIGCHACTVACKAEHDVPLGVNRTWVKYIEKGEFPDTRRYFSVLRCNHCEDAPCATICPVTALFTREDGIVDFDPNRCIGCKACIQGCPYDALYIDPNSNTAAKCNYCAHRVEVSLEPPCAVVCPEHAIIAGDMDDPATEIARLIRTSPVQVRKPEKGTRPKVYYIGADSASLVPSEAPTRDAYVWSEAREPGVSPRMPAGSRSGANGFLSRAAGASSVPAAAPPAAGALTDEIWDRVRAVMGEKASRVTRVYDAGQTHQGSWGWKVSAYLWTKSIASGCLLLAPFIGGWGVGTPSRAAGNLRLTTLVLSLVFLAITGALLVADLKRPDRFLWVLTRPQWRSWLTRGSYILLGFGLSASVLTFAAMADFPGLWKTMAPIAVVFAAAGAIYTAFLFWQSKGRDLWQSPLLPVHLLVQAILAGLCVLILARPAPPPPHLFTASPGLLFAPGLMGGSLVTWLAYLLPLNAGLILLEIFAIHQTEDASAAARWLRSGRPGAALTWGVMAAGHLLPFALLVLAPASRPAVAVAALLSLAGLAIYEHLYVQAGQTVPLS